MKLRQPMMSPGPSVAYIPLTQGMHALVDSKDAAFLAQWNWCASEDYPGLFYARRIKYLPGGLRERISMHRLLTECPAGLIADHINGNTLDNRRCNVRTVTSAQSVMNRGAYRNNKSGHPGVFFDKRIQKYTAQIQFKGLAQLIGYFPKYDDAVAAYLDTKSRLFGEYMRAA